MTKYLDKSFSVCVGDNKNYRDNWDAAFGRSKEFACDSSFSHLKECSMINSRTCACGCTLNKRCIDEGKNK